MRRYFFPSTLDSQRFSVPGPLGAPARADADEPVEDTLLDVHPTMGLDAPAPQQHQQQPLKNKKKASKTTTITVIADFDNPWKGKLAEEIDRMKKGAWEPSEDDFDVVSRGGAEISHYMQLFALIVQKPKGTVSRVNVFTHANSDMIAFHGNLKPKSTFTEVLLTVDGSINAQSIQDWPTAEFTLEGGAKTSDGKKKFTIKDVQARFTEDAEIIFYACHSGVDTKFLHDISTGLGAKARGFSKNIAYCPKFTTTPPSVDRGWVSIQTCKNPVKDFNKLQPDRP